MSLPYLPLQTGEGKRDLDALYGYMGDFIGDFANAVGSAIDPKSGEGGNGALTVDDMPTNVQYDAGSTSSLDDTLFGHIDVSADLPDRAVDMAVRYRETGTTRFKVSYSGSDESSYRIGSLKVGESYQIQVAGRSANNSVGPYSPLTTVTMPTTGLSLKAPANGEYVVTQLHDKLSAEKLLTDTPTVTKDTSGVSEVKLNVVTDSSVQRVEVSKNSGAIIASRRQLNLIEGMNVALTVADNDPDNQADVTIGLTAAASGYTTVQEEGVAVTARQIINFVGTTITAVDNAGAARTDVTVTASGLTQDQVLNLASLRV